MPAANGHRTSGRASAGRTSGGTDRPVPTPVMGHMALGFGLVFLLLRPQILDGYANDGVPQYVEPVTNDDEHLRNADIHRHSDFAQRLRLHRALDVERKLGRPRIAC
jgi:hypothetical protein